MYGDTGARLEKARQNHYSLRIALTPNHHQYEDLLLRMSHKGKEDEPQLYPKFGPGDAAVE